MAGPQRDIIVVHYDFKIQCGLRTANKQSKTLSPAQNIFFRRAQVKLQTILHNGWFVSKAARISILGGVLVLFACSGMG